MGELKHTPGPWWVELPTSERGFSVWASISETSSMQVAETGHAISFDQANAFRIVACVNACEGMDDPQAEITRLKGEVERLKAFIGTAGEFAEYSMNKNRALIERAETAEAKVQELEAERDRAVKAYTDEAQVHDVTKAQLAELRARVRPGVWEIAEALAPMSTHSEIGGFLFISADITDVAHTIHAMLPPAPKVLSEIYNMLENVVPTVDPQEDVDCQELFQAVVSRVGIVKDKVKEAMGGGE